MSITLDTVRNWPPAVSVTQAAQALGISPASAYRAVAAGTFPAEVIRVGNPGRMKVLTATLVTVLEKGRDGGHGEPA